MKRDRPTTIFHFSCAFCGAKPGETPLATYLATWSGRDEAAVAEVLDWILAATHACRHGSASWTSPPFLRAVDGISTAMARYGSVFLPDSLLDWQENSRSYLNCIRDCPVCQVEAGQRDRGSYFTIWPDADKVQMANLCHDSGLILDHLLSSELAWLGPSLRVQCKDVRQCLVAVAAALDLMTCAECGRQTSCLYGATSETPHHGLCRCCVDRQASMTLHVPPLRR